MTARRVLHLASNRWNSAIAEYALSAARALSIQGCESELVVLEGSPLFQRAHDAGLVVKAVPSFAVTQLLRVRALIAEFKPDVVISHGGPETVLAGLAVGGRTPIFRVRGYAVDSSGVLAGLTHDAGQWGVKRIIAPSAQIEHELKKISKIPTSTIPLGLDTARFAANPQYTSGPRPTLLIFGRLDPVKGHREFMAIFKRVLDQWQGSVKPQLQIIGQPANLSVKHLEEAAIERGLKWQDDVVVTAERVADVSALLSSTTLGVVSSLGSEIICRVAQEFLVCGAPLLVSGTGSLDEVLISPQMGASYKNLDSEATAKLILEKLPQYFAEDAFQRNARARAAKEEFSLERMGERLMRVLFTA